MYSQRTCAFVCAVHQHVGQRHACEPMRSVRGAPALAAVGVYTATHRLFLSEPSLRHHQHPHLNGSAHPFCFELPPHILLLRSIASLHRHIASMSCHVMQVCPLECTPYAGRNKVNTPVLSFLCLFSVSPFALIYFPAVLYPTSSCPLLLYHAT